MLVIAVCLLIATSLVPAVVASSAGDAGGDLATGSDDLEEALVDGDEPIELVVRFKEPDLPNDPDVVEERLETHADDTQQPLLEYAESTPGVDVEETFWVANAVVLTVDPDRVDLAAFEQFDDVEEIHENFELAVPEEPPEIDESNETADERTTWGLEATNVPTVWRTHETRGEGVRVAVLDTGIDVDHPDLELYTDDPSDPTYPGGWAEFDETGERVVGSTPHDTGTHGTHVSGTVAGGASNGTAIGVAPDADLMHGLVLEETGGTFAQVVAGMEWAVEADADVVSVSFGTTDRHHQLIEPVRTVDRSGAVVVSSIGNEGHGTSGSPGNVYESIAVGAVDEDGSVPEFSGGERIDRAEWEEPPAEWPETYVVPDVVAPGVAIESSVPGGYESMPGTSMATPHVAGTVALLRSIDPGASSEAISTTLRETAWKPDGTSTEVDTRYGYGIVDAAAAADELAAAAGETDVEIDTDPGSGTDGAANDDSLEQPRESADRDEARTDVAFAVAGLALLAIVAVVLAFAGRTRE
ncbi:peptidase S8 [Natrarchaeobius oligotrophus]|uniref:Peptidase S8 n=1 Tax=Natrarchaeobius chitinivorans TaxID=1679083 RepID=A0A3N6MZH3_NATCH|nr:peptidase S8 [Natrarchaeobius chitinivorans]